MPSSALRAGVARPQSPKQKRHCEPVTDVTGVRIPWIFSECYGERHSILDSYKIYGIATPVCALVRNDTSIIESAAFPVAGLDTQVRSLYTGLDYV